MNRGRWTPVPALFILAHFANTVLDTLMNTSIISPSWVNGTEFLPSCWKQEVFLCTLVHHRAIHTAHNCKYMLFCCDERQTTTTTTTKQQILYSPHDAGKWKHCNQTLNQKSLSCYPPTSSLLYSLPPFIPSYSTFAGLPV